jgi:hypothetical protein
LYVIITTQTISGSNLLEALKTVLKNRERQIYLSITEVFEELLKNPTFEQNWSNYISQINVDTVNIKQIIDGIRTFIIPVYETLIAGKNFLLNWNIFLFGWI